MHSYLRTKAILALSGIATLGLAATAPSETGSEPTAETTAMAEPAPFHSAPQAIGLSELSKESKNCIACHKQENRALYQQ